MTKDEGQGRREQCDLEERTARFGEAIIAFARQAPATAVTESLIRELVRSATHIGASCCQAGDAPSKRQFRNRINVCQRHSRQTQHWLRMIATAVPEKRDEARELWREARDLHLVFASIYQEKTSN